MQLILSIVANPINYDANTLLHWAIRFNTIQPTLSLKSKNVVLLQYTLYSIAIVFDVS